MTNKLPPIHPGEILKKEFLEPLGISGFKLAIAIDTQPDKIYQILNGKRSITPNTALRLSIAIVGTIPEFWLNLQQRFDLEIEKEKSYEKLMDVIVPFQIPKE